MFRWRSEVADNKQDRGEPDRSRVAAGEHCEIEYLARKTGITPAQARELVRKHGNDHATLEREAARLT